MLRYSAIFIVSILFLLLFYLLRLSIWRWYWWG